jgi:hypothetical protein
MESKHMVQLYYLTMVALISIYSFLGLSKNAAIFEVICDLRALMEQTGRSRDWLTTQSLMESKDGKTADSSVHLTDWSKWILPWEDWKPIISQTVFHRFLIGRRICELEQAMEEEEEKEERDDYQRWSLPEEYFKILCKKVNIYGSM